MASDARKEAQRRVERIVSFRAELSHLEEEGGLNLTPEQRTGLEAHLQGVLLSLQRQFGVDATDSAKRASWGMRVVALLAVAALSAALVLFLNRVWGNLSTTVQISLLTFAPLALLAGAEAASARQADRYYVALLAISAGAAFVAETNVLGSIVNLIDSPQALLAWGLFAVLVAYAYGLRLLLGAGLVLLAAYCGSLIISAQGDYWVAVVQRTQFLLPGALILYCMPWLTRMSGPHDFDSVYRLSGAGIGLLSLLILSTSGDLCCGGVAPGIAEAGYQLLGLLLSAGVIFHGLRLSLGALVNAGAGAFMVFLFVRLHAWWWEWMPKYLFFLVLGLIAMGRLLVFRRIRTRLSLGGSP